MRKDLLHFSAALVISSLGVLLIGCGSPVHVQGSGSGSNFGMGTGSPIEVQSLEILSNHCASCHSNASAGGVSKILDIQHLISAGIIVPGSPNSSPLLKAVQAQRMPPGTPLSNDQIATLVRWIVGTNINESNSTLAHPESSTSIIR